MPGKKGKRCIEEMSHKENAHLKMTHEKNRIAAAGQQCMAHDDARSDATHHHIHLGFGLAPGREPALGEKPEAMTATIRTNIHLGLGSL